MSNECNADTILKNYFKLDSDSSNHYQCVEKCSTTNYKFLDSKTTPGKSYCVEKCPELYPYYSVDT